MRLKIRTKIILSFFAPIIPLTIIVVIFSGYLLNNLYNEAQRLDDISKERMKVTDLRLSLDRAVMPVNDYIITGARKYADDFNGISIEVEERLKAVEDVARTPEETEIVKDVKVAWQNIKEIAIKTFTISAPVGNKDAARLMEEMDYKWGYPAIERLKRWREIDIEEYKEILERHNMAWHQLWVTMTVGVISFLVICLIYILIYSLYAARNEEELRKSNERFYLAVRGTNDGIWDWDIKTNTNYFSPRFLELLNYGPDELPNELATFEFLLHPEDRAWVFDRVRHHLEDKVPYNVEYRMRTKDGEYRWFQVRGEAIRDQSGKPFRMAGSITDITARKKAEEKLKQYIDELERFQKVSVKREFRIRELQERVKELRDENESLNVRMAELEEKLRKA